MGKTQKKQGKGRLDKFYHLAKDSGYRARSAFKLIQLAKKYDFLSTSHVCLDLCAAPGGWCQVAKKFMPLDAQVIGVDLVPIAGLKGVTSIVADITTQKCRQLLKTELKGKLCDVVLNDGAPNVGANWAKDAYTQSELTLHAGKLACEHLRPGGTFVTKIFRSADYNSLLWVFGQLFNKVEATKPQASRNVSAEIFVVCQGFKAPSKLDPRFFDPKHVFMEAVNETSNKETNLSSLMKKAGKKNRGGYEEGDTFRTVSAADFFGAENPAQLLMKAHQIIFPKDCDEIAEHEFTTPLIRDLCKDLKVLSKGDLSNLIKWRFKFLKQRAVEKKAGVEKVPKMEISEEDKAEKDLETLIEKGKREAKADAKKRREKEKREALRAKASLGTFTSNQDEPDLFQGIEDVDVEDLDVERSDDDDEEDEELNVEWLPSDDERYERMDEELGQSYKAQKEKERMAKTLASQRELKKKKETRREKLSREWAEEMQAFDRAIDIRAQEEVESAAGSDDDDDDDDEDEAAEPATSGAKAEVRADRFFSSGMFEGIDLDDIGTAPPPAKKEDVDEVFDEVDKDATVENEMSEDDLPVIPMTDKQKRKEKRRKEAERQAKKEEKRQKAHEEAGLGEENKHVFTDDGKGFEIVPQTYQSPNLLDMKPESRDELAETLAIGSLLTKKKSRMELLDSAFHRYAFDDPEDLPDWFVEEERPNLQRELPVSKELMADFRGKLKEINQRPIRKVAEAQGRKKKRAVARLEKLRKQANTLANNEDLSAKGKVRSLKKMMSKAKEADKQKNVVVASRKTGGAVKGSKGKAGAGANVKVVDKRLKSDKRGQKRADKKAKAAGRKPKGGPQKKIQKGKRGR
jgi:AdoMet-dependent rRNA methyltransferase SPB1